MEKIDTDYKQRNWKVFKPFNREVALLKLPNTLTAENKPHFARVVGGISRASSFSR